LKALQMQGFFIVECNDVIILLSIYISILITIHERSSLTLSAYS
jgi:hypothetical protein